MAVILDDKVTLLDANSIDEVITSSVDKNYNLDEIDERIVVEDIIVIDANTDFIELTNSDGEIVEHIARKYTVGIEIKSDFGTTWTPEVFDNIKPSIGIEFACIEDAFNFYSKYALAGGFEARRSTQKIAKDDFGVEYDLIFGICT